jgi:hypothetical protein
MIWPGWWRAIAVLSAFQVAAAVGALDGGIEGVEVEQSLVTPPPAWPVGAVVVEHGGDVDEGALDGGDRDAVLDGDLVRVEASGAVEDEAVDASAAI